MKKVFFFFFLLVTLVSHAQTFEGTVTWSVKYEFTDPARKAQMEKAQKSMDDPANQAKMKQMQEQMNSPEMKKMMEANPQMKERMEAAMKMMQGGEGGSMLPKTLIIKTKGNSSVSKMEGGMMGAETLYDGDKKQAYMINRNSKTYMLMNAGSGAAKDSVQRKVTKTGETMKVLGYNCTKYIVDVTTAKGTSMTQIFWTSTDIKGMDMRSLARQRMGNSGQSIYYEGIDGVPLRIEMNMPQMNMAMEVTDIKKELLPASDFTIPSDFTETKGFGK